jgi:hypothetical protein
LLSLFYKLVLGGFLFTILGVNVAYTDAPPFSHNVTVSGTVRDTIVTFLGYSSPNAFLTIQEDGAVVGTTSANSSGGFNKSLYARVPGTHAYGIFAEDSQARVTPTYGFILNLAPQTETVISNLLLPTTIDVNAGVNINILGETSPNSTVTIFVHSGSFTEMEEVGSGGDWDHLIATYMDPGFHNAYARVTKSGGLQSIDSNMVNFDVTCKIADLNCDGRVDLIDFSIMMYYWGTSNPTADINHDGIVDLIDFSIMMYYWEG